MSSVKAFGSISIIDSTDVGRLSVYLTSTQPQTVIENPNENIPTYTPDWNTSNLILTPIVFLNENQLQLSGTGLEVVWKKQEGSSSIKELESGESVSEGVLTVSRNVLGDVPSGLLTYIATIQYTDPNTDITLETQAQMTFALAKQATDAKYCSIQGESAFLYNSNQVIVGSDTITLTASLANVSVTQWQYKNSTGDFVAMTTTNNPTINGNTIIIKASENILFNNDIAVIKLVTNDSAVYDIHTITKIRDGAAGNNTISVVLSNESHTFPCDSSGSVTSYTGANTTISVFEGGTDVTNDWNIAYDENGCSGTFQNNTYTVTEMTDDAGYVEFSCTKSGASTLKKRFTLIKQKAGLDGDDAVVYTLRASTLTLNLNQSNVFSPKAVTFSAYKQVGNETSQSVYNGRFKIFESTDGVSFSSNKYTSGTDEATKTYTPSATSIRAIKCELYAAGSTTTLLDSQTVMVTKDGIDGEDGNPGEGGTSVVLGNEAEVIPCNSDGTVKSNTTINIPFYGYIGIKRAAITCQPGTLPDGVTVSKNTPGTTSAGGLLVINIPAGNALGNANTLNGNFTLNFTCNSTTVERKFSWAKSIQASNAVLLQIYAPQGDVIVNGSNSVELETQLTDGSTVITQGITYQWSKFSSGIYQNISGATQSTLTVTPDMVESLASFKCTATYGGKPYIAYWTVTDKNDPITLLLLSSVGTQLTSDSPFGVVYTIAYLNGEEIDPILSTSFLTAPPSSPQSGDFYYHIDKTQKTVVLKKYNGTSWQNATEKPIGTYKYYRRNAQGVELDQSTPWKEGKVVYIDREIVDKSLVINCEAEIPLS